ncbi:glycosyltransferase [Chryseobacterium koreense]|uniref:glycosyltransferase n=1 Tax=Chryseobacterium koreense TaxID=232216 RepID=UPI0026EC0984|nr:glycosyltransferase [Chryseobacterium koreense]
MKILFHENELNYRGTSIALYDYADFNEKILGNESVIAFDKNCKTNHSLGIEKFRSRFEVFGYDDFSEVDSFIQKNNVELFYAIKNGDHDGIVSKECKTAVHAVFKHFEPHGDVYAYVSEWLALEMTGGKYPFVPHMVNFEEDTHEDLKKELNIPKNAKVFGYFGGSQSFNIQFAQKTVEEIAAKYREYFFIFMGVDSFIKKRWWKSDLKNIIFLPPSNSILYKLKFINTCNALLHARERGETFGITVAEFALKGKPVITFADSPEKAHLMELGNDAYLYRNKVDLKDILLDADLSVSARESYKKFLPEPVMEKFKNVFI